MSERSRSAFKHMSRSQVICSPCKDLAPDVYEALSLHRAARGNSNWANQLSTIKTFARRPECSDRSHSKEADRA